ARPEFAADDGHAFGRVGAEVVLAGRDHAGGQAPAQTLEADALNFAFEVGVVLQHDVRRILADGGKVAGRVSRLTLPRKDRSTVAPSFPPPPGDIKGRRRELRVLAAALRRSPDLPIVLLGGGGTGKSLLAC